MRLSCVAVVLLALPFAVPAFAQSSNISKLQGDAANKSADTELEVAIPEPSQTARRRTRDRSAD